MPAPVKYVHGSPPIPDVFLEAERGLKPLKRADTRTWVMPVAIDVLDVTITIEVEANTAAEAWAGYRSTLKTALSTHPRVRVIDGQVPADV